LITLVIKVETNSTCHPKINSNIVKVCASKINYFLKNDKNTRGKSKFNYFEEGICNFI